MTSIKRLAQEGSNSSNFIGDIRANRRLSGLQINATKTNESNYSASLFKDTVLLDRSPESNIPPNNYRPFTDLHKISIANTPIETEICSDEDKITLDIVPKTKHVVEADIHPKPLSADVSTVKQHSNKNKFVIGVNRSDQEHKAVPKKAFFH